MDQTITVTENTKNGLEYYNCPDNGYNVGDKIPVNESIDIFINGNLTETYVEYMEIVHIDREFVINEKEWYVYYEVKLMAYDTEIKREKLELEDLEY